MDISMIMKTLVSADTVGNISKKTGASKSEVKDVLKDALPLLLKGAQEQETDKKTQDSFMKALEKHSEDDTSDIDRFFDGVDMEDGAKIIGHLLGGKTSTATKKKSKSNSKEDNTELILAAAAPLLMSLLGQETKKSSKSKKNSTNEMVGDLVTAVLDNVDVGSLLMNALGAEDEEDTKKKKTTTKKKTAAKKTTKTAAKKTTKKKAADDDGIDIGDAANLLMKLLK